MLLTDAGMFSCRLVVQVDRKKLKTDKAYVPNWQSAASAGAEEEYEAASTALGATIQRVWQEVLGQDRISVASDFFQIGGNSLRVSITPLVGDTQTRMLLLAAGSEDMCPQTWPCRPPLRWCGSD